MPLSIPKQFISTTSQIEIPFIMLFLDRSLEGERDMHEMEEHCDEVFGEEFLIWGLFDCPADAGTDSTTWM